MTDIQDRTMTYALRAIKLVKHLQQRRDGIGSVLARQYLRAATSIGANLVEAQAGESRRDFVHKCSIAQKEARESKYWLTLLQKSEIVAVDRIAGLVDETEQIIAILTTIIVNTKKIPS